jgi:hypothetical protein
MISNRDSNYAELVGFFSRRYAPGLESGMTLKEWDALYGEGATRKRIAQFRRPAIAFGVLLLASVVAVFLTYGRSTVPPYVRLSIATLGMVSLCGFLFSIVILLSPWLLSFADPPKLTEHKTSKPRRKRRRL